MEGGRAMRPESIHKAIQLSRQIKYVLIVQVKEMLAFSRRPHNDVET